MNGLGTPTHTMIPPSHPFYNKDLEDRGPILPAPDSVLAEAGIPKGFNITIHVPAGRPTRERVGIAVREMLKPARHQCRCSARAVGQVRHGHRGKGGTSSSTVSISRPTIDTSVYPWYHSAGSWNTQLWHYTNPDMDRSWTRRGPGSDGGAGQAVQGDPGPFVNDPPGIVPYVINHVNAYRKAVKGFQSSPMMWLDFREVDA